MDVCYDCKLQWFHDFLLLGYLAKFYSHGVCLLAINVNCEILRKVIVPHFDICI